MRIADCGLRNGDEVAASEKRYLIDVYGRPLVPLCVVRGRGARIRDIAGKEYIDCCAGIASNNVGHCHPKVVEAVRRQAGELIHTSNWVYTVPQVELAARLVGLMPGMHAAYMASSGTEAIEAAIKMARRWGGNSTPRKWQFICMDHCFHGRTLGALSATWKPAYREPFVPLVPGFTHVPFGDAGAVRKAVTPETAAVLVEPIQGEAGIIIPPPGYLRELREICDEKGVLLILDEVQTGFGRTGKMFASDHEGVRADIVTVAKALGGGLPIGAAIASEEVAKAMKKGEHGTTFGGNPLSCAAALATLDVIEEERLPERAERMGGLLAKGLEGAPGIREVRQRGLMVGVELPGEAKAVALALLQQGVVAIWVEKTLRLLPPLVIGEEDVGKVAEAVGRVAGDGGR